jgi:hypothetical protein
MFQTLHGALIGIILGGLGGAAVGYGPAQDVDVETAAARACLAIGLGCGGIIGAIAGHAASSTTTKPISPTQKQVIYVELAILALLAVVGFLYMFGA